MRLLSFALLTTSALLLSGCTSSANAPELIGESRAAINKTDVRIFNRPPSDAQAIANLQTTYALAVRTTDEEKLAYAIGRLQHQAAKLGANVIVITEVQREASSAGVIVRGVTTDGPAQAIEANPYIRVAAVAYYSSASGAGREK